MFSAEDSLVLLLLLVAATALIVVAQAVRVPYPILLVIGGLALGFVPGIPPIELPPDLVLVAVLPPLLYGTAFFTSLREFRANMKPIVLLAVGLVLLTMVLVAVVAHSSSPASRGRSRSPRRDRLADRPDGRDRNRERGSACRGA